MCSGSPKETLVLVQYFTLRSFYISPWNLKPKHILIGKLMPLIWFPIGFDDVFVQMWNNQAVSFSTSSPSRPSSGKLIFYRFKNNFNFSRFKQPSQLVLADIERALKIKYNKEEWVKWYHLFLYLRHFCDMYRNSVSNLVMTKSWSDEYRSGFYRGLMNKFVNYRFSTLHVPAWQARLLPWSLLPTNCSASASICWPQTSTSSTHTSSSTPRTRPSTRSVASSLSESPDWTSTRWNKLVQLIKMFIIHGPFFFNF